MNHRIDTARIPLEVNALIAALNLQEQDTHLLRTLPDNHWQSLLEFCDTSHLTLALTQLPLDQLPTWVCDRLRRNLADNALRYERIKKAYSGVAATLERAQVEHIVIKGFTQAPGYVSTPQLRAQSDLDLYCPVEQIEPAQAALELLGYRPDRSVNVTAADHVHGLIPIGEWTWKGNRYDPEIPLGIDLHFCLWNQKFYRFAVPETDLFWQRRTTRQIEGFSFPCLNSVDHLGYLCLHILRNLLLRDWIIHHVRELAFFLHSHADDDAFWSCWNELHSPYLRSLQAIAFYHARAWFQCRLHPQAEQEIAALSTSRLAWLERFSNSSLENMFAQNKDEVWLHLSLLSSRNEQWRILKRTLVPPRLAAPSSATVRIRNKRLVHQNGGPLQQYLSYLIHRSASHTSASLSTLLHGLSWWLSRRRLPAP